jgi:arylsulfatase A-like enzyme
MPTLGYLAGVKITGDMNLEGENIWQLVTKGVTNGERILYWRKSNQLALRAGNWKLVHNGAHPDEGDDELFDIARDPFETKNLAEEYPHKVAELKKELKKQYLLDRAP